MKIVETGGLYHYNITGKQEKEAAAELEARLDAIMRDYRSANTLEEIAEARRAVAEKFGVEVKASTDPGDFPKTPQAKYDAANTTQFKLKLNNRTDADIIEFLQSLDNRQGFIKKIIRDAIKKEPED